MAGGPTEPLRSGILIPMNPLCKPCFAVISGLFGPDVSVKLSRLARLGDFVANLFAPARCTGAAFLGGSRAAKERALGSKCKCPNAGGITFAPDVP
jgi:hypothetical protein